ncbi:MAG: hypothetical protein ACOCX9_01485 [Spirochaetota bacterium]
MKVVHVLKRIETIDQDIKELRKIEKSLQRNKSFTQPIYISIEKQINILLGERIKLFELKIANPPESMLADIEDEEMALSDEQLLAKPKKKNRKTASSKTRSASKTGKDEQDDFDEDEFSMLTQDQIDKKISSLEEDYNTKKAHASEKDSRDEENDDNVKLLDIALEKGTLKKEESDKDKKKVRFFKDNFPGGEY